MEINKIDGDLTTIVFNGNDDNGFTVKTQQRGFQVAKGFEDKDINLPKRGTKYSAGYDLEAAEDILIPSIWSRHDDAEKELYKMISKAFTGLELTKEQMANQEYVSEKIAELPEEQQMDIAKNVLSTIVKISAMGIDITDLDNSKGLVDDLEGEILSSIIGKTPEDMDKLINKLLKPTLVPTGLKAYMAPGEVLKIYSRSSSPLKSFLLVSNGIGVVDKDYYSNPDNDGHIFVQFLNFGMTNRTIKKGDKIAQGIFEYFLTTDDDDADGERIGGHGSTGR